MADSQKISYPAGGDGRRARGLPLAKATGHYLILFRKAQGRAEPSRAS